MRLQKEMPDNLPQYQANRRAHQRDADISRKLKYNVKIQRRGVTVSDSKRAILRYEDRAAWESRGEGETGVVETTLL